MHRDPKQVMCSKAFSIFFIATLSWVSSSCPSFPTNIGDHMPWVHKYQALSELPKPLHFFWLIRVTFNSQHFLFKSPKAFRDLEICKDKSSQSLPRLRKIALSQTKAVYMSPTNKFPSQLTQLGGAPALHKRCHRHLDLLALAQSTFRFNSDSRKNS